MAWDDIQFETGLVDNFTATIESSTFGTDARYNNGESVILRWELRGQTAEGDAVEETLLIPVGKNWEAGDGGKVLRHVSGEQGRNLNQSTLYARVISRCVKDLGISAVLQARGEWFEAPTWEGLTFRFKREEISYGASSGIAATQRLLPVEYLGEGAVSGTAAVSAATTANAAAATSTTTAGADPQAAVRKAKVSSLAKQYKAEGKTHDDFIAGAMAIDGVADDEALTLSVVEESGIWATA